MTRAASIAEAGIARAPPLLPLSLSRTAHDPPARASPSHAPPRTVRARTAADASTWAHVDSDLLRGELLRAARDDAYLKPPMPVRMRSCSYDTQNTSCHGPRRSQPGTKPL